MIKYMTDMEIQLAQIVKELRMQVAALEVAMADLEDRGWVGLTDDEIDEGLLRSNYAVKTAEAWRAGVVFAMTKLKEKST